MNKNIFFITVQTPVPCLPDDLKVKKLPVTINVVMSRLC